MFQVRDRPLDIGPCRVLSQYRTYHDFERRIARPPVLRSIGGVKLLVDQEQWGANARRLDHLRRPRQGLCLVFAARVRFGAASAVVRLLAFPGNCLGLI